MRYMMQGTCLICGKPVLESRLYCNDHREQADIDNKIIQSISDDRMFLLVESIFRKARADYLIGNEAQKKDAEAFFRGQWAQLLSLGGFDPDEVIAIMDEEIENGLTRATVYPYRDEWE